MPFENDRLDRATWGRNMKRPLVTSLRPDKLQDLKKRKSQGEGEVESLNHTDGQPMFIFGLLPFTDDYYI
jgi:hypothetical protein